MPSAELRLQVTAVFVVPVTNAENCCVCDGIKVTLPGVMETATGLLSEMVAVAIFEASAVLVAITVMVCDAVMAAGAV